MSRWRCVAKLRSSASWGPNVFIKVPVTNTAGDSTAELVRTLSEEGVQLNITALMLPSQVEEVTAAVHDGAACFISVFAGRIADAGYDPLPIMPAVAGDHAGSSPR